MATDADGIVYAVTANERCEWDSGDPDRPDQDLCQGIYAWDGRGSYLRTQEPDGNDDHGGYGDPGQGTDNIWGSLTDFQVESYGSTGLPLTRKGAFSGMEWHRVHGSPIL